MLLPMMFASERFYCKVTCIHLWWTYWWNVINELVFYVSWMDYLQGRV